MSTSGDVQYIGGCSVHQSFQYKFGNDFIKLLPHIYHDIPPMY